MLDIVEKLHAIRSLSPFSTPEVSGRPESITGALTVNTTWILIIIHNYHDKSLLTERILMPITSIKVYIGLRIKTETHSHIQSTTQYLFFLLTNIY